MEARELIRLIRRHVLSLCIFVLGGAVAGAIVGLVLPSQYSSTASLYVSTPQALSVQDLSQGGAFTQEVVKSYASVATAPIVLDKVISSLSLDTTAAQLANHVSAIAPAGTTLLQISVTDDSPSAAAQIANQVATTLSTVAVDLTTNQSGSSAQVKMTVIQQAVVSSRQSSASATFTTALGALLGLMLGLVFVAIQSALDTRLRRQDDVEEITPVPILGGIFYDPTFQSNPIIIGSGHHAAAAESIKRIRTNLEFLDLRDAPRVVVVTSSIASEGKTTTVCNLAVTMAEAGSRVLLIDADLRRPRIAPYLGLEGVIGLTDVLIGQVAGVDAVQQWGTTSLYVLPAGRIPPNPSELLQSDRLQSLLSSVASDYDIVLMDAPPILAVTDSTILAKRAGGVIVVCSVRDTRKPELLAALGDLEKVSAPVFGIILTKLALKGPDGYSYGHYSYASDNSDGATRQDEATPDGGTKVSGLATASLEPIDTPSAKAVDSQAALPAGTSF